MGLAIFSRRGIIEAVHCSSRFLRGRPKQHPRKHSKDMGPKARQAGLGFPERGFWPCQKM